MNFLSTSLGTLWCSGFSSAPSDPVQLVSGWAGWFIDSHSCGNADLFLSVFDSGRMSWEFPTVTHSRLQVLLCACNNTAGCCWWKLIQPLSFKWTLKKAYGNIYIAVLHLSDLELPENILKTWKEAFRGLDSNKTSVFCNCFSVFTMGNNSYGQCGRKVVEDEIYRWEFKDPELSYCWKHNCMKTTLQKSLKVEKVW